MYRRRDVVSRLLEGIGGDFEVRELTDEEDEGAASAEEASQRPIIRLVDMMLADGVTSRASDIHVEPIEGGVAVRYRIDGVLRQVMKMPRNAGLPLDLPHQDHVGLDIADRLRPQDGRARVSVNGEPVDLRVSTLPGVAGREGRDPDPEPEGHGPRASTALGMHEDEQQAMQVCSATRKGSSSSPGRPAPARPRRSTPRSA